MKDEVEFRVVGESMPKGSTRSFYIKKINRVVTTDANKGTKAWEERVRMVAEGVATGFYEEGWVGYEVSLLFLRQRPRSLPKRKTLVLTRPDLDKYVRAVLDALTGVLFPDDAQVVGIDAKKWYARGDTQPGVLIKVKKVREPPEVKKK